MQDGERKDCSIGSTSPHWLRFLVINYPQIIYHLRMSGICRDGRSESATSSQVHTPVEAQQQGKPSVSDCQVPADGCELPLSAEMTKASHYSSTLSVSSFVLKKLELRLQVKKKGGCGAMLILELGIWVIPLTLIFAPCRRLVHLVAELQRVGESMMRPRSASPAIWSRLERLNSVALII